MTKSLITDEEEFDLLKWGNSEIGTVLSTEHQGSGRWTEHYRMVWSEEHGDETFYFAYDYEEPSTEMQDVEEEFEPSNVEEVFPVEVKVIQYITQKELDKRI